MNFDWNLFVNILSPIIAIFIGVFVDRYFKERPLLLTYLSHTSAIYTKTPDNKDLKVHTHAVVIQNIGRTPSINVRVGHNVEIPFPSFSVYPPTEYKINKLPDGSTEILFPKIVPKERIYINYLYFPPTTWNQINTYTKSDEGPAKIVNMQLIPATSKFNKLLLNILIVIAIASLFYILVQVGKWFISSFL